MSEIFPLEQLDFKGFPQQYNSSDKFRSGEGGYMEYHTQLFRPNDWGMPKDFEAEEDLLFSKTQHEEQHSQLCLELKHIENLLFDVATPPSQPCQEQTRPSSSQYESSESSESPEDTISTFPSASLEILKNCGSKIVQLSEEKDNSSRYGTAKSKPSGRKLSTEEILRLAGEKFIQSSSQSNDDLSLLIGPDSSSSFYLSDEEAEDVELAQFLLISAEKVGEHQYDHAIKLLDLCDELSSTKGNPVQRLVCCLSKALRQKINLETGGLSKGCSRDEKSIDVKDEMMSPSPTILSFHRSVPFSQVSQFTGVQAIVENVAEAKRVHIIELEIRSGMQCTILMQALASRSQSPLQHFKVTAFGTKSRHKIEETGKRLKSFAQSMNIPFSFHVVMVENVLDLNENLFTLDAGESVAVISSYFIWTLLPVPSQLERLMGVIRNINPCVMVITEIEVNLNSPVFVTRFTEALFFYGAFFDAIEDCMDREDPNRWIAEAMYLNQLIKTIVATEGDERTIRHVKSSVWRAFFARFGMVEKELSMSSWYQASLVLKNFVCGNSCTLARDGKGMIIGWKGTPVHALSTWKFR